MTSTYGVRCVDQRATNHPILACGFAPHNNIHQPRHVLTPGRYVGAEEIEVDGVPFEAKMSELSAELYEQMTETQELDLSAVPAQAGAAIRQNLEVLKYGE